jgi:cobalt/nickel transport system ATP-binding protein
MDASSLTYVNGSVRPAAVGIRTLTFAYHGDHDVLKEVSLQIEAGERFGIIGPSGAGKSTLLLHLNGTLQPRTGQVEIDGTAVDRSNLNRIRQLVGLVFQNPDDQLFNPTVGEDVAFGPLNMGLDQQTVEQRVQDALRAMNLEGFEDKSSHHISYGERKRAALATVLAMSPSVVAFDEPFSNLNPAMVEHLIEIIRNLSATVIVVSQSILPMALTCDRLAVLENGRIAALGDTRTILTDRELLQRCSLDFHFYCETCRDLLAEVEPRPGADDV